MKGDSKQLQLIPVNFQEDMHNQGAQLICQQVIFFHNFDYMLPFYEDNTDIAPVKHKSRHRNNDRFQYVEAK